MSNIIEAVSWLRPLERHRQPDAAISEPLRVNAQETTSGFLTGIGATLEESRVKAERHSLLTLAHLLDLARLEAQEELEELLRLGPDDVEVR